MDETFCTVVGRCDRSRRSQISIVPSDFEIKKTPERVGDHLPLMRYAPERDDEMRGLEKFFSLQIWKDQPPTERRISGRNGDR
jgi:hypothetical protein